MSATAETLIHDLAKRGVRLSRHDDRLRVEAEPGAVTPDLRLVLSERKSELLAALGTDAMRDRLARLADAELIAPELIQALPAADVAECAGLSDEALRAYVRALCDCDLRKRGKRPSTETARAVCSRCGPVWVAPEVADVAPVVDGWPRVLGCPWCHVKNRRAIPRPSVQCRECKHFAPDTVNPPAGLGRCRVGERTAIPHYPMASRECGAFQPEVS